MNKRTVLIVDDQKINRMILGNLLEKEYDIIYAKNGAEAMECLHSSAKTISAVILDIIMPIMDGYEFLKQMRQEEEISTIPVIVSSQEDGDEAEIHALSLGAQDFIAKPYKADIIRHRLSNLIKLKETSAVVNRAEKDPLTGLYNKQFFLEKVSEKLRQNPDKKYDLICMGVEHFKLVNDLLGVKKGDETLIHIGGVLQEACGEDSICGRFNSDCFFALREHSDAYSNEILQPWENKAKAGLSEIDLKLHCGIYEITNRKIDVSVMCDRAMLAAEKNRGKYDEYFSYYDDSIRQKLLEEQFITSMMQTAIEERQFQVYYQPKYDLNTEKIVGAEALVRWIHPEKGFMSPGEFIPVFEKNGFITKLDMYVWETACRDIKSWMELGYPPVAVSVNVSRADIYNPKIIEILLGLVKKYEIPMRYLHLEITESAYTENPKQIIEVVAKLRELGFLIEMDDFGTGYSSLNMLSEMPVDVLKLDIRFIQTEANQSSGRGILSFIISLAKWLGLAAVAEGVETKEQIDLLRSMDCNYVQGYYFAKPMKESEFEQRLANTEVAEMVCATQMDSRSNEERKPIRKLSEERVMLIVDDIEVNRASLAAIFEDDFIIVEKENGKTAWEYILDHYKQIDMIMLDFLMPVMDGFQLLAKIRGDERTRRLPVIITSQGEMENEERALSLQADDFVSKPYNPHVIRQRVKNVVQAYQFRCMKEQ